MLCLLRFVHQNGVVCRGYASILTVQHMAGLGSDIEIYRGRTDHITRDVLLPYFSIQQKLFQCFQIGIWKGLWLSLLLEPVARLFARRSERDRLGMYHIVPYPYHFNAKSKADAMFCQGRFTFIHLWFERSCFQPPGVCSGLTTAPRMKAPNSRRRLGRGCF